MEDRRTRTHSMEGMVPQREKDIQQNEISMIQTDPSTKSLTDGHSPFSPKSVMSSPNLISTATKRDPFRLSKILHFKEDKKVVEDRGVEFANGAIESVSGVLAMHLKSIEKKRLFYVKSKYRVVVHAEKPTMDLYSNESKAIPSYMLSLCNAVVSIDPKTAECAFSLIVQAWTKHTTIHYRPQMFVFYEERQDKLRDWLQCIERAIANAAKYEDNGSIFRTMVTDDSTALYSDDDAFSQSSSDDDDAVIRTLKKLNPFSPKHGQGNTPSTSSTPRASLSIKTTHSPRNSTTTPSEPNSPISLLNRALHPTRKSTQVSIQPCHSQDKQTRPSMPSLEERNEGLRKRNFALHQPSEDISSPPPPPVILPNKRKKAITLILGSIKEFIEAVARQSSGLGLSVCSGVYGASYLCPFALAGLFANTLSHSVGYIGLVASYLMVHSMASYGLLPGISTAFLIHLALRQVDIKEETRQRYRAEARQLTAAEKSNYTNFPTVQFPSWVKFSGKTYTCGRTHNDVADKERAEWLNIAIARSWPYMRVAIRNSLLYYVNPMLETNTPAAVFSSITLTSLELGELAPAFGGIKCIPEENEMHVDGPCSEISFDAEVRFIAGEDQLAEVKLISHMGAAARIRLKDAIIVGTMRITLRPMATVWPTFSGISISFISPPRIEFSLTAAKINITNVPFASEWHNMMLHNFIQDMVTDNIVWPKVLDIPFWDPNLYPVEGMDPIPQRRKTVNKRVEEEKKSVFGPGVVSLHVRSLFQLLPSSIEVYAILSLQQSHKTEIRQVDEQGSCTFDEKVEFYWEYLSSPVLQIELWQHHRAVPDVVLATATMPLGHLAAKRDYELKVPLQFHEAPSGTPPPIALHIHVCRRLFSTVYQLNTRISAQPRTSAIEGLGHDVCVGMLFVTLKSVVWTTENESASVYGVLTCEKQRATSTTQCKLKTATWLEMFNFFVYSVDTATLSIEWFETASKSPPDSLGTVTTSVVELRKRLASNQETFTETFSLQQHGDTKASVTLMFQWRQLMS